MNDIFKPIADNDFIVPLFSDFNLHTIHVYCIAILMIPFIR